MDSSPAFLYYNPEGPTQSRHQFVSQPPNQKTTTTEQHHASAASSSPSMPFPSALVYQSRPSSSHMKPQHIHAPTPIIATSVESLQKSSGLLTPSSPTLLGLDGPNGGDMYFFPPTSTPELNTGLHTPLHSPWGLDENCSGTVTPSDMQLSPSTPDVWKARSPMSPAYNLPMNHFMSGDSSPTLMLSSCPSLSPTSSHSGDEIDFCDPRQLTTYPLSPHHSESDPCPFIAGDADDHFLLHPITIKLEDDVSCKDDLLLSPFSSSFDVTPAGTINPADLLGSPSLKRTREEDEDDWDLASTFSDESILESSDLLMPLSPPPSDLSRAASATPPSRKKSKPAKPVDDDLELDAIIESSRLRGVDSEHTFDSPPTFPHTPATSFNSDSDSCLDLSDCHSHDHSHSEQSHSPEPSTGLTTATTTPVVRRGRKQSLTADPSKTFACHLCTRRFRRQEHLKRHFRSLHTREKPFSCPECGKKFSRSDNLSQHARTHGSATIHMTMCEDMLGTGGMVLIEDESRREDGECCGDE